MIGPLMCILRARDRLALLTVIVIVTGTEAEIVIVVPRTGAEIRRLAGEGHQRHPVVIQAAMTSGGVSMIEGGSWGMFCGALASSLIGESHFLHVLELRWHQ